VSVLEGSMHIAKWAAAPRLQDISSLCEVLFVSCGKIAEAA